MKPIENVLRSVAKWNRWMHLKCIEKLIDYSCCPWTKTAQPYRSQYNAGVRYSFFNVQIFHSLNNKIASNYREMANEVNANRWNKKLSPEKTEKRNDRKRKGQRKIERERKKESQRRSKLTKKVIRIRKLKIYCTI